MKKGLVIGACFLFILIVLMSVVSAGDLPFEVNRLIIYSYDGENLRLESSYLTSSVYDLYSVPDIEKEINYLFYVNGMFYSFSSGEVSREGGVPSPSISSLLKVGENKIIITTEDLTIDEQGNFVKSHIINQYGANNVLYQRLPDGTFALCHDKDDCIMDPTKNNDKFNFGPNVGAEVTFYLTQEELDFLFEGHGRTYDAIQDEYSGVLDIKDYSVVPVIGVPSINTEVGGELFPGRKVFLTAGRTKPEEAYSIYFNDNFVKEVSSSSSGEIRAVFEIQENWVNQGENKVSLKNSEREISDFVAFDDSFERVEWSGGVWLNKNFGYYGDTITVYGFNGFRPNKEYTVRISYEGVPGGSRKVTTNSLGEFQIDGFEINPPVLTDIILFVKNIFSGNPDMPSEGGIRNAIKNLRSVGIVVKLDGGGVGSDFYLCDNAPGFIRTNYCAD